MITATLKETEALTARLGTGGPGENGGYYIPEVTQDDTTSLRVSFTASKEGMQAVEDQVVELPAGPAGKTPVKGEDYFTDADREELVTAVLAALPDGDEVSY